MINYAQETKAFTISYEFSLKTSNFYQLINLIAKTFTN